MVRDACVVLSLLHAASGRVGRLGSMCAYCCLIWRCFFMWIGGKKGIRDCWEERGKALLF